MKEYVYIVVLFDEDDIKDIVGFFKTYDLAQRVANAHNNSGAKYEANVQRHLISGGNA